MFEEFFKKKNPQEVLFVQRNIEKDSLWKLPSSISLSIYTVFWQSLSKEDLQEWDGYTWTTSAPAKELKHLQSMLKLKTPFVILIPLPWMDRKVLVWKIVPLTKDSIFLTYSKWLAPGLSLLDNTSANARNWMAIQPHPGPLSFKWLSCFLLSFKSMDLKWLISLAFSPKNSEGLGQYQFQD